MLQQSRLNIFYIFFSFYWVRTFDGPSYKVVETHRDIYKTYKMIEYDIPKLKSFRDNVDKEIEQWFNFAVKSGEEVNTIPSDLRLAKSWS